MEGIVSVGFGFHAISILEGINGRVWIEDPGKVWIEDPLLYA